MDLFAMTRRGAAVVVLVAMVIGSVTACTAPIPTPVGTPPHTSTAAAPATGVGCTDFTVYTLRGSGETGPVTAPIPQDMLQSDLSGLGTPGRAFYDAFATEVSPNSTVGFLASPYPALPILLDNNLVNPAYPGSIAAGHAQVEQDLAQLRGTCAETTIIAVGYSQGAQVLRDEQATLQRYAVQYLVLFGDPEFCGAGAAPDSPGTTDVPVQSGTFDPARGGLLGCLSVAAPPSMATWSYCHALDPVCQGLRAPTELTAHLTYHETDAKAAAWRVADRERLFAGSALAAPAVYLSCDGTQLRTRVFTRAEDRVAINSDAGVVRTVDTAQSDAVFTDPIPAGVHTIEARDTTTGVALDALDLTTRGCGEVPVPGPTPCPTGQQRDASGACALPACVVGQHHDAAGTCQPDPCPDGQQRDPSGACVLPACPTGQQRDDTGNCQPDPCPTSQHRDDKGQCVGDLVRQTVDVPAAQPWTDTGLDIGAGSTVHIAASGTIKIAGSDPGKQPGGETPGTAPSVYTATSDYTAPGFPCYSLIVRIGEGAVSEVAAGTTLKTDTAGRLYLGVNDNVFGDNSGSWQADIVICPGDATDSCR